MRYARASLWVPLGAVIGLLSLCFFGASAAVYSPQQALTTQIIQEFLANPADLLTRNPQGGGAMIARVRDLSASDPATLRPIVSLLPDCNFEQAQAIGAGLGQTALMAVKADQAYANEIQEALATAGSAPGSADGNGISRSSVASPGSDQPKIGNAITTKDQVDGMTEKGTQPLIAGTSVYSNEVVRTGTSGKAELLFNDRTNITVAPITEIRLDKFVYDPGGGSGNVLVVATTGAFRFITGLQAHENYQIKTPYATMGVRGTEFTSVISPDNVRIQLGSGVVIVTTISNKVVTLDTPGSILLVDLYGNTQNEPPTNQPLVDFADLGPPVTNIQLADALDAFNSVTGTQATGSSGTNGGGGGGGGGGNGTGTGSTGGGFFAGNNTPIITTSVVNTPLVTLSLTSSPIAPVPNPITQSVSPTR